ERPYFGREHGELGGVAPPPFERLLQLAAIITQQVMGERQIEPVDRPAAEQAAIGSERGQRRQHLARAIERERTLRHQPQRLRIRRHGGLLARRLERSLPVTPSL